MRGARTQTLALAVEARSAEPEALAGAEELEQAVPLFALEQPWVA